MRARAPASSANLGPGFDVLAVALNLYVTVSVEPADRLIVTSSGEGADLPADAGHLAARVATAVAGHDRLAIDVHSEIPLARGLGSSAALAVAAAAAAGAAATGALEAGVAVDGHPENAAASTLGGLVAAAIVGGRPVVRRLALDSRLRFVLAVPDRPLATAEARAALPELVSHADAAFNLGRMGLLIAGLADHTELVAAAAEDRLHQGARTTLFPESTALLAGLGAAGAAAACWSGAGPTLVALCSPAGAPAVAAAASGLLAGHGIAGRVIVAEPDLAGVTVTGAPAG